MRKTKNLALIHYCLDLQDISCELENIVGGMFCTYDTSKHWALDIHDILVLPSYTSTIQVLEINVLLLCINLQHRTNELISMNFDFFFCLRAFGPYN